MKNLTTQELNQKARNYDNIQNEGGEGFNPYRDEQSRREMEASPPPTRVDVILHTLEIKDCSIARECGTYNQAEIDALHTELAEIKAKIETEFFTIWTLEKTKIRRESWNGFVKSLMDSNGRISGKDQPKLYARRLEQGWGLAEVKKAVKYYNL